MKIAFLGDIALIGKFGRLDGIEQRIKYLKDILNKYDYVVANLESPLTKKSRTIIPKSMHIKAEPECVKILEMLGVDAVSLANNHIYDYGRQGVEDTIKTLDAVGIKWCGIDGKYLCEDICEERFNLSGFCCLSTNGMGYRYNQEKGVNTLSRSSLESQIKNDVDNGAVSVISVHFGMEHTNYPAIEHIRLFSNLCNKYPIIVHGHHPHQIQGITQTETSVCAYSLGNALFDDMTSINGNFTVRQNEDNKKSFVLGVDINDGIVGEYEIQGFYIGEDKIMPLDVLSELSYITKPLLNIGNEAEYENRRKEQFQSVLNDKFGKHDLRWVVSRLNYYSIGAKISAMARAKKYKVIRRNFL